MSQHTSIQETGRKLDQLAAKGLERAQALGADAAKIITNATESIRLVVENKTFALADTLNSQSLGLVVHQDQKKGTASINSTAQDDLERAIASALTLAKYSVADECLTMPDAQQAPQAKAINGLFDETLTSLSHGDLMAVMDEAMRRLTSDSRIALDRFEMSVGISRQSLLNSRGVSQSEAQTMVQWDILGMAKDADCVSGMDYDSGFSFDRSSMADRLLTDVDRFIEKVVRNLQPGRCPTYRGPVLLGPRAVSSILLKSILFHASGRQVMDGKSRWATSIDQDVVSPLITIRDDPRDTALAGATAYDDDGLPTNEQALIERGRLRLHLYDCYSARRMNTSSNAMAGGPFCLTVEPGASSLTDLNQARPELLYVDRFSGNTDPLTGDFSGVAKSSRLFRNGKDAGAVGETMIAGNAFELLGAIIGLSSESFTVSGSFRAPAVLVDHVSVTGT